jgi:acetyl-CoA synthetase
LKAEVGTIANTNCKVLGSVGEPINPEAWHYYNNEFGGNQCAIVDTYWQTETGSIIITPLPFVTTTKPGSATFPFFGIQPQLLDPETYELLQGNDVEGLLAVDQPWPSMARTIWRDHQRFIKTYIKNNMYITGDTAFRDADGYIWIRGRVDDVVNVAGHRLSTAEVESALVQHPDCIEAASIGIPDEMSGQAIMVFVVPKYVSLMLDEQFHKSLINKVREQIGPIATPKYIVCVPDLPKTRSGKLMRRLLRQLVDRWMGKDSPIGDLSTLADPTVLEKIEERLKETPKKG